MTHKDVGDNETNLYLDRFKLGLEDARELKEFVEKLHAKEMDEWDSKDYEEPKKLHEIMKLRWEITQETSKKNGAVQDRVDQLEKKLADLLTPPVEEKSEVEEEQEYVEKRGVTYVKVRIHRAKMQLREKLSGG